METSAAGTSVHRDTDRAGLVVVVAAGAIIIGSVGSAVVDGLWVLILLGFLGMVYGMPGLHRYQAPRDGWAGKWGALLVRYGGGLMVLLGIVFLVWELVGDPPEEGPGFVGALWMVGFAAFVIGVVLFAIGAIRAKVLPVASSVLMLGGLLAAIAIDMSTGAFFDDGSTTTEWGFYIGVPVFALGLGWAGYTVWKGRDARSSS